MICHSRRCDSLLTPALPRGHGKIYCSDYCEKREWADRHRQGGKGIEMERTQNATSFSQWAIDNGFDPVNRTYA